MQARLFRYIQQATAPTRRTLAWFDLVEIALVAFGFLCYFLVRGAVVDRTGEALANARWIIEIQRSAGLLIEPALNSWALADETRVDFFNFVYFWLDFPLIVGIGLVMFVWRRFHYTLLRDALLISGAFALVVYAWFPVAPPRYLPEWGFVDTMEQFANLSYQAQSLQPFVNPFAAVPSLHVGWAVLLAVVLFMATPGWRGWGGAIRVGSVFVLVMQTLGVMATANHYFFDALIGALVALAGLFVAMWLQSAGYPRINAFFRRRAAELEARLAL